MTFHIPLHELPNVRDAAQACKQALDELGIEGNIIEDHRHGGMDLFLPDARAADVLSAKLSTESAILSQRILRCITIDGVITARAVEGVRIPQLPRITLDQTRRTP
ncbi:MAG TPA: hypothetical protein VJB60_01255 [Candidatus Peribacterales bacterium]|nr:hypothetical protein [Candidatus Peribacterales bacterium]